MAANKSKILERPVIVALLGLFLASTLICCIFFLSWILRAFGGLATLSSRAATGQSIAIILSIAFLSMALIQALRSVVPLRGWFHESKIRRHLLETEWSIFELKQQAPADKSSREVKDEVSRQAKTNLQTLLDLANATDDTVFFNLPMEQVCGQISAVAELLLSDLAPKKAPERVEGATEAKESKDQDRTDRQFLLTSLAGPKGARDALTLFGVSTTPSKPSPTAEATPPPKDFTPKDELRNRLAYHVQRNIDQLQITVKTSWQRRLRVTAMVASFVIALTAIGAKGDQPLLSSVRDLVAPAFVVGLVAGYLASVFRDLIAIVERLRH